MERDPYESLRDWLDEVKDAIEGPRAELSARLKEALEDAVERMEDRLDDLGARLDDAAGKPGLAASGGGGARSESESVSVAVDGPIPKVAAASSASSVAGTKPLKVGVNIRAEEGAAPGDVDFKMSTKALGVEQGGSDVAVSGSVKSVAGKLEKLDVKVAVGDWAKDPGDADALDFLILMGGGRKGLPEITRAESKDVDLILNVNLKGLALKSKVKADGLKAVKVVGKDGVEKTGYLGQADADGSLVKILLKQADGATVGVLALDIQTGAIERPSFPDFAF